MTAQCAFCSIDCVSHPFVKYCTERDLITTRHLVGRYMSSAASFRGILRCWCTLGLHTLQVAGHTLLPAATMLEVTAAAAALLRPPSGKGAAPLLTAITLPRALQLAPRDHGSEPPQAVRLHVDQLSGSANLVTLNGGDAPPAQLAAASAGNSIHLAATASRLRHAGPVRPGGKLQAAEEVLSHLIGIRPTCRVIAAPAAASWAAISTPHCEPDIAASVDCCLHLGAVLQPRSAARSLRVPAGAASHLGGHAQPNLASAYAAASEGGQLELLQTFSNHWLVGQAAHGGPTASTQGLVSKPMSSSAKVALTASVLQTATSEVQAEGSSQMVYEVVYCVNAPATAEGRMPAQAASFALPRRSQLGQHTHDGLLRGMAASLATAQQAHGSASQLALRTAGTISHDGSVGPHGRAGTSQAARGAAAWSLARCLEAEASGELQCSGFDSASAVARSAASMEMLLGNHSRSGLVQCGMDMRTSALAGEMTFRYYNFPSPLARRQVKILPDANQDQLQGWRWTM